MNITLDAKIESILFFKNEPVSFKELAKILNVSEEEIKRATLDLKNKLENRGLQLMEAGDNISLATHSEMSEMIETLTKEELVKDLSKAALETLSIIVYKNPISRSELDYIRGVNSQFIIRALTVRGLIEKRPHPKDERMFVYEPSLDLLRFLGVSNTSDMPKYNEVEVQIQAFVNNKEEENKKENEPTEETH